MTSLRERLKRLVSGSSRSRPRSESLPDPELAYTIHWTRLVREWDAERRHRVHIAVRDLVEAEDFRPNQYKRIYRIPELDAEAHAGASLMALHKVLRGFEDLVGKPGNRRGE